MKFANQHYIFLVRWISKHIMIVPTGITEFCRLAPSRSFFLCYSYLNKIALKSSAKDHLSKIAFEIARERSRGIHFCERAREGKQMTLAEGSSAILFFMPARALRFRIQRSPANLTSDLEQVFEFCCPRPIRHLCWGSQRCKFFVSTGPVFKCLCLCFLEGNYWTSLSRACHMEFC